MPTSDTILIMGLEFYAYHGATDEEQKIGHRYRVDARLAVDIRKAGASDSLEETVNYAEVALCIQEVAQANQYRLIESLAERVVSVVFARFSLIEAITLKVEKIMPPYPAIVESVGVEIFRIR